MKRIRTMMTIGAAGALALAAAACGGEERPARSATQTTSAQMPTPNEVEAQRQNADLMRQRDEARAQAEQYKARADQERALMQSESDQSKASDTLLAKAWGSIDDANTKIEQLQAKAKRSPKDKSVQSTIDDLQQKRDALERDLRKLPSMRGAGFNAYTRDVNDAIDQLDGAVQSAPEGAAPQGTTPEGARPPTGTHGTNPNETYPPMQDSDGMP